MNINRQLSDIHHQWLAGNLSAEKELSDHIDKVVAGRLCTLWKNADNFPLHESTQDNLIANLCQLLLKEYWLGKLSAGMTATIENTVIDDLLGLIRNESLGQYPKLDKYFCSRVSIILNGLKPFNMTPVYAEAFKEIVEQCRNSQLDRDIQEIILQFVLDVIGEAKFPAEQIRIFEKRAVQELVVQFKQKPDQFHRELGTMIKETVLDCLDNKNRQDEKFGAGIKNAVINTLLVQWKTLESNELQKSVESIVMKDCNALIQEIDESLSKAMLMGKIQMLEEKNALMENQLRLLVAALSKHDIVVEMPQGKRGSVEEPTKVAGF